MIRPAFRRVLWNVFQGSHPTARTPHVSEDRLIAHGSRHEQPVVRLLVSVHAAECAECRAWIDDIEAIGAALLEVAPTMTVSAGLRRRALAAARRAGGAGLAAGAPGLDRPGPRREFSRML